MADTFTATSSVTIKAEPSAVWTVITDPELVSQAFFGAKVDTDWQVGGPITWSGEWKGRSYEDKGTIEAFDPPKLLRMTHFSPLSGQPDKPENYHTVTFELVPRDGGTELTITQTNAASEEERAYSEENWTQMLNSIKSKIER